MRPSPGDTEPLCVSESELEPVSDSRVSLYRLWLHVMSARLCACLPPQTSRAHSVACVCVRQCLAWSSARSARDVWEVYECPNWCHRKAHAGISLPSVGASVWRQELPPEAGKVKEQGISVARPSREQRRIERSSSSWGIGPRTPTGRLKPLIVPNPINTVLFLYVPTYDKV